jgi:Beta- N-acetylglucosaminidase
MIKIQRNIWLPIMFLVLYLIILSGYDQLVLLKNQPLNYPQTNIQNQIPVQISLEKNDSTYYNISLNQMASDNKLQAGLLDPSVLVASSSGIYEFLSLKWFDGITADDLSQMLKDRGILDGHEQDFLNAAKQYNINPVYLVAHARVESGNGTSDLARGIFIGAGVYTDSFNQTYTIDSSGIYYNLFGIHAYDGHSDNDGSIYAASQKWDSISAAIFGGAKWLSDNYINHYEVLGAAFYDQDTLYQMRFDPNGWAEKGHGTEYAIDQDWAQSIASLINQYSNLLKGKNLQYDIPRYNNIV